MTDDELTMVCLVGLLKAGWAIGVFVLLLKIADRLARIIDIQEAKS